MVPNKTNLVLGRNFSIECCILNWFCMFPHVDHTWHQSPCITIYPYYPPHRCSSTSRWGDSSVHGWGTRLWHNILLVQYRVTSGSRWFWLLKLAFGQRNNLVLYLTSTVLMRSSFKHFLDRITNGYYHIFYLFIWAQTNWLYFALTRMKNRMYQKYNALVIENVHS